MSQQPAQLQQLIEPAVESLGYELVGVEYRGGATNGLLRIYIDHEDGITVDDCQKVSHQLSGLLDVEDPIQGHYALEVSSPGLDRPLFKAQDFARFAGQQVKVRMHGMIQGRRNFTGLLLGLEGDSAIVEVDGEEYLLPLDQVDQARLIPEY
jgi:ribosome maturation factor RimP